VNRFSAIILTTAAVMLAGGCGGGGKGNSVLKEGDILVVTQALEREKFEASYGEVMETPKGPDFKIDHTDGDIIELDVGTELEVVVPPKSDSKVIVVKLSKSVDGLTGEELKEKFVPERFRTPDFLYYRISLKSDYLGNQVKKKE
jgi:hypothetical protein